MLIISLASEVKFFKQFKDQNVLNFVPNFQEVSLYHPLPNSVLRNHFLHFFSASIHTVHGKYKDKHEQIAITTIFMTIQDQII